MQQYKTKNTNKKETNIETIKDISNKMSQDIKNDINEKWFHFYEWIDNIDMIKNLNLDFVSFLSKLIIPAWIVTMIIVIASYIINFNTWLWTFFTSAFYMDLFNFSLFWLIPIYTIMVLVLMYKTITKSLKLYKSNYAVFTDEYINVGWKIVKYSEYDSLLANDISKLGDTFKEPLLERSEVTERTSGALSWIKDWYSIMLESAWKFFWFFFDNKFLPGKDIRFALIMFFLVLIGVVFMTVSGVLVFIVWFILLAITSIITSLTNKGILKVLWNKTVAINDQFKLLDSISLNINKKKDSIKDFSKEALGENWTKSTSTELMNSLKGFNKDVKSSTEELTKLKSLIDNSEYSNIFNNEKYSIWVKKNLLSWMKDIYNLLVNQIDNFNKKIEDTDKKISNENDTNISTQLWIIKTNMLNEISELSVQKDQLENYIKAMESSLNTNK